MSKNITFSMLKPDAVEAGHTGAILKMIEEAGFRIVALKKHSLARKERESFMPCIKTGLSITICAPICRQAQFMP